MMIGKYCTFLVLTCLLFGLQPDCPRAETPREIPVYRTYTDIPGVTADETVAVEALKKRRGSFNLAMILTTEAFHKDDGSVGGFSSLFCAWLTGLFGVPFTPEIVQWDALIEGLASRAISFTGELTANPERRKSYYMTDPIAERSVSCFRLAGSGKLSEPTAPQQPRFAFLQGATTGDDVRQAADAPFTAAYVKNYDEAVALLRQGAVDAFFAESPAEAAFDVYSDIVTEEYFPLIYTPVSFSTADPELAPIIGVVQKYLEQGGVYHLTKLYNQGEEEYRKHKFFQRLAEEEKAYLRAHGGGREIPVAVEYDNYPFSFYNTTERQWQGIALDVLREIGALSGLSFVVANEPGTAWPELLGALTEGKAALIAELIPTKERRGHFLWPEAPYSIDYYALISRSEQEYIQVNQLLYSSVALPKGTAYEEIFDRWFPNHRRTVRFDSQDECFAALEKGEVDFVMAGRALMLNMTHYQEKPGFKVNLLFSYTYSSSFGLNKNETTLCSIIDKAQKLVDTDRIADRWMHRVFDYQAQLARTRLPYIIGLAAMLTVAMVLLLALLRRSRRFAGELAVQAAAAADASRAKSEFLSRVSHEIRTPMNVVVGLAEVLLRRDLPPDAAKEVRHIKQAGISLLSIINDILDLSKIEAGKMEIADAEYALSTLLRELEDVILFRLADKPVAFTTRAAAGLPDRLRGDMNRVRQILLNLLGNAVKYTHRGSITLTVSGAIQTDGRIRLSFEVADTGIGIRQEDIGELFNSFMRIAGQSNQNIEGTGLGLPIARSMCRAMGGDVAVTSEYGKGSVFTAVLLQGVVVQRPRRRGAAAERGGTRKVTFIAPEAEVLVVDDLPSNLLVAEGLLTPYRMRLSTCTNGREAVDLIKKRPFDLVLMDHMMPEMDGIEATAAVRALDEERCRTMPVIALTANAVSGMREMFLENGFNDFLSKPIDMVQLNRVLAQWIPAGKRRNVPEDAAAAPEGD